MHIVLVYRYYNDGIVYYNLTFCTRKSLMTDLGLIGTHVLCIRHLASSFDTFTSWAHHPMMVRCIHLRGLPSAS